MATATQLPSPTPTATPARSSYQIDDSTDYMAWLFFLWHPDQTRTTVELPIALGAQPWSSDGRQLVGYVLGEGKTAILTLATGELSLIGNITAEYAAPHWSPDGRLLTYAVGGGEPAQQLAIYDFTTQEEILLGDPLSVLDWIALDTWSFDSKKIALTRWTTINQERVVVLEIIDVETGVEQRFRSPEGIYLTGASWSPVENQLLVYGSDPARGEPTASPFGEISEYDEIYLLDLNSGALEQLKAPSIHASDHYPAHWPSYYISSNPWSSDGQKIIYADRGLICYMTIASREENCLAEVAQMIAEAGSIGAEYPSWSPSGKWISFILKLESNQCSPIAVVRMDGTDLRYTNADAGDCSVQGPIWSPRK